MTTAKPHIWFIGPFPPPLSGQSNYNKVLKGILETRAEVICFGTGEGFRSKILCAIRNTWIVLARIPNSHTVYTSLPGQRGLWLFLLTIAAFRLRRLDHFVHHHSFRSVNLAPMASHRWLARLGGRFQRHVFLGETMYKGYANAYLTVEQRDRALVVPNAFLFAQDLTEMPARKGPVTISHLSVMTREKGVDYLLELIERLLPDTDYRFILAGGIKDKALRIAVEKMVAIHSDRIEWVGPVQGEAKAEFYARSDLFILPSKLVDEADPLVLLESFAAGTVALASNRGCIPDRVMSPDHLLSMSLVKDVALLRYVAGQIETDRGAFAEQAQTHAQAMFQGAQIEGEAFLAALGVGR